MHIFFHGAAREIGKSCIEVQSRGQRYLLDAGIKFVDGEIQYPKYVEDVADVDAVFLLHAHLDHSGALAFFEKKRLGSAIYTTKLTWSITKMLLEDMRHIQQIRRVRSDFTRRDIERVEQDVVFVDYDKEYVTRDGLVKFRYFNSGHIPGGCSVYMEIEGKTLLYTSDINTQQTRLMVPSDVHERQLSTDVLIIEGTYGSRSHPDRTLTEEAFIRSIEHCLMEGGSALVPVFGVGRSQEILLVLETFVGKYPIYLDGMARGLLDEVLRSEDPYIQNTERLRNIAEHITKVYKSDRSRVSEKKGVIIVSTSGMLEGGPSSFYARKYIEEEKNFILLTGYQAIGTQGRSIYDNHVFFEDGQDIPVRCHVRKFDFSAHLDREAIHRFLKSVQHTNLFLQHGDPDALDALEMFASKNLSSTVYVPQLGERVEI